MKVKILSTAKIEKGNVELPVQFKELIRPDLVKRAVEAVQSKNYQPYGSHPEAGMRASAKLSRRRHDYRGSYGFGISRVPRKILSRRGTRFSWVGAVAPGTVSGRRAHPPKAEKIWEKKINKKERRKAIRSAIAATVVKELVSERGHVLPDNYPFIIEDKIESMTKTKDVKECLTKLGFKGDLERTQEKSIRSGKGKTRGRKYRKKKGLLIVVSKECQLIKSANNIPGIDIQVVSSLNAELLAPGGNIGRMTLYTEGAIARLSNEKLFTEEYKGPKTENPKKAGAKAEEKPKAAKKENKKTQEKKPVKEEKSTKKKAPAKKTKSK